MIISPTSACFLKGYYGKEIQILVISQKAIRGLGVKKRVLNTKKSWKGSIAILLLARMSITAHDKIQPRQKSSTHKASVEEEDVKKFWQNQLPYYFWPALRLEKIHQWCSAWLSNSKSKTYELSWYAWVLTIHDKNHHRRSTWINC